MGPSPTEVETTGGKKQPCSTSRTLCSYDFHPVLGGDDIELVVCIDINGLNTLMSKKTFYLFLHQKFSATMSK